MTRRYMKENYLQKNKTSCAW